MTTEKEFAATWHIHLRDTRNGETAVVDFPSNVTDELPYIWTEGDYACDCNRSRFMYGQDAALPCNVEDNIIVIDRADCELHDQS